MSFIYGSAGTGKTTMVDIVCEVMPNVSKIAIANTNPAVDNLRRKIGKGNCEYHTVAKYLNHPKECDVLIIDECSTVSNRDICRIVEMEKFKLLILVGDERQIESIKLGNWFSLAREFLPKKCIHEFVKPWRAANDDLSKLWTAVRETRDDIAEILSSCEMTSNLDDTILKPESEDEIVLCLNYDGLYGINNINKLLQTSNTNKPVTWNLHTYKVNDPILFNESNRFYPLLYNNLKGRIVSIDDSAEDSITFDVAVDIAVSELDAYGYSDLEYIDCIGEETFFRFSVHKDEEPDEEERDDRCIVPFQVAYAVSIHKAQGLEYSSVKLIITKDVEKRITHNIFYTAITRARESLRIYWSPESQRNILSSFKPSNSSKDSQLLSNRFNLSLHPTE